MQYQAVILFLALSIFMGCGKKQAPLQVERPKRFAAVNLLDFKITSNTKAIFVSCCDDQVEGKLVEISPGNFQVEIPELVPKKTWALIIFVNGKKFKEFEDFIKS